MNEFSTYEYVVAQKRTGKYLWRRIGMLALYVVYVIAFFTVGIFTRILVPCLALVPLTTWILWFFTWRYVCIDYEYSITSGILTFTKIFGNRTRRVICEFKLKDAAVIAPLNDKLQASKLDAFSPEITYSALSAPGAEDGYFITYEQDGRACVFLFEATAQALKICRFYNPSATVVTRVRF